jgi:hypothetical protein
VRDKITISFDHENDPPHDWIFTFGFGQWHGARRNNFVRIHGTFMEARKEMFRCYGRQWSMQYPSEQAAGVQQFNLKEIEKFDPDEDPETQPMPEPAPEPEEGEED